MINTCGTVAADAGAGLKAQALASQKLAPHAVFCITQVTLRAPVPVLYICACPSPSSNVSASVCPLNQTESVVVPEGALTSCGGPQPFSSAKIPNSFAAAGVILGATVMVAPAVNED